MTINELGIVAGGGNVEADIDKVVNDLMALLLGQYQAFVPAFFNGVIAGPVRHLLNDAIGDVFFNGTCNPTKVSLCAPPRRESADQE